jgi:hypothetical protein
MAGIDLNGFDMVWGVTENTVNSQLEWMFESGAISNHVKFGNLGNDGVTIDGLIAPAVVNFNTGTAKRARMFLTFASGTVTYWEGFGPAAQQKQADLKDWKIALLVNLNLGALAGSIRQSDTQPGMSKETLAVLQNFRDSMFSINNIFLDMQNADLVDFDAVSSSVFPNAGPAAPLLSQQFGAGIRAWITDHRGGNNPYVLGYAVLKKGVDTTDPVLRATGASFSTQAWKYPGGFAHTPLLDGLSTLNFLLVCDNRNIAGDARTSGEAAGIFNSNLVAENDIDGSLVISRSVFTNKYIVPFIFGPLRERLKKFDPNFLTDWADHQPVTKQDQPPQDFNPDPSGLKWTYVDAPGRYWSEHDMAEREDLVEHRYITANVSLLNNADKRLALHIEGQLQRYHHRTHYTSGMYVRDSWVQTTVNWHIDLTFVAGVDGKINITTTGSADPPIHDHGDGGLDAFADFFKGVFGMEQDWDKFYNAFKDDPTTLNQFISRFSKSVNATEMCPILPAPKVAFYKNIHLNGDGNIQVDLTYKAQ